MTAGYVDASQISGCRFGVIEGMRSLIDSSTSRATAVATAPDAVGAFASIGELAAVNLSAVPLLSVRDLNVHFPINRGFILQRTVGHIRAVNGVSFDVNPGETLGVVGESGSGKTTVVRAVIQLERPTSGSVIFQGEQIVDAPADVFAERATEHEHGVSGSLWIVESSDASREYRR